MLGVKFEEFYCCGKLKSVSLSLAGGEKEKNINNSTKNDCCKTTYHSFKVKDTHLASAHIAAPSIHYTDFYNSFPFTFYTAYTSKEVAVINGSHAPPLFRGVPVYISNCVFRI